MRGIVFGLAAMAATSAFADCALVSDPCVTDQSGHTYITRQNFGGGFNTYRDGSLYSQTEQDLSGAYIQRQNDGTTFRSNSPYFLPPPASQFENQRSADPWQGDPW